MSEVKRMRIAVAGGTGVVGRYVVEAAQAAGHETVVISRSAGVDLVTGSGLADALKGADAVIDVSNTTSLRPSTAVQFFSTVTSRLLAAEADAGVPHHVALSIIGIDRVPTGYYAGKLRQEELIEAGTVPWTVLRATQFHEFPAQLLNRIKGPVVPVPAGPTATVAAREVAGHLLALATGPAQGHAPELAGPEVHPLPALVRQVMRALGRRGVVVPVRLPGKTGTLTARGALLPTGPGPRGQQTFAEWLAEYSRVRPAANLPALKVVGAASDQAGPLGGGPAVGPELVTADAEQLGPAGRGVLPGFLAAVDGHVQQPVDRGHDLGPAAAGPVGLEEPVPVAQVAHLHAEPASGQQGVGRVPR